MIMLDTKYSRFLGTCISRMHSLHCTALAHNTTTLEAGTDYLDTTISRREKNSWEKSHREKIYLKSNFPAVERIEQEREREGLGRWGDKERSRLFLVPQSLHTRTPVMELTGSRIRPSQDRACCLQIYSRDQKNSSSSIFNDDKDFKAFMETRVNL